MEKRNLILIIVFIFGGNLWAEDVTVYRDEYGVPHIFAGSEEALCYGAGYAQAEDRLEELLKNYLRAEGRMAEVFGEKYFQDDYLAKTFRHAAISREKYQNINIQVRSCIEAFVQGVRTFMQDHPEKTPAWATLPEAWQVVALSRFIIFGWPLGEAYGDLRRGGHKVQDLPYRGSNQWVISPNRSDLGVPIALIDPHLSWYEQFRFYECRLYGGGIQFSGLVIVGTPFSGLGHTKYLSIAMTTGGPDTADIFEVEIDPENSTRYRYDGEWRALSVRREKLGIKKGDSVEWREVTIESTHHGPILTRRGNRVYAVAISYAEQVLVQEQFYRMIQARNLEEMKLALSMLQVMAQNIMVGTVQGDIFYLRNGRVPVRPIGFDFSRPVPGNTSASEWQGIHPISDLIQMSNPSQGYMQNCNISPAYLMKDSPLTREKFQDRPYLYNESDRLHQRAAMVLELLDENEKVTQEQAVNVALSTEVYKAGLWQKVLRAVADPGLETFRQSILRWDRRTRPNSKGALAYKYWKEALGEKLARLVDPFEVPQGVLTNQVLLSALRSAAGRMYSQFGTWETTYGQVHRVGRRGGKDYPVGGGTLRSVAMATPRAIGFGEEKDGKLIGHRGQTATQLVILSNPPRSFTAVPLGQSDNPNSAYWDDQSRELFSRGRLKSTYFLDKLELMKHVTSRKTLKWH